MKEQTLRHGDVLRIATTVLKYVVGYRERRGDEAGGGRRGV